jgi:hypothetical protein
LGILSLSGTDCGCVIFAGVLHAPSLLKVDLFVLHWPLIGVT